MNTAPLLHRLAFALALSLSAASLVAFAAESSETTDIEVVANGKSEKVSLVDLKIGETRQLYSEAGTLVTATRTAESLELDIAGDKTSIKMLQPGDIDGLGEAELAALIEAHGGADGDVKRIVRIHREHADGEHAAHADGAPHKRIVVLNGKDGELRTLHGDHADVMVKHLDAAGDGKQVIVKRRVVKDDAVDAQK
jgi:hypothetical protein